MIFAIQILLLVFVLWYFVYVPVVVYLKQDYRGTPGHNFVHLESVPKRIQELLEIERVKAMEYEIVAVEYEKAIGDTYSVVFKDKKGETYISFTARHRLSDFSDIVVVKSTLSYFENDIVVGVVNGSNYNYDFEKYPKIATLFIYRKLSMDKLLEVHHQYVREIAGNKTRKYFDDADLVAWTDAQQEIRLTYFVSQGLLLRKSDGRLAIPVRFSMAINFLHLWPVAFVLKLISDNKLARKYAI